MENLKFRKPLASMKCSYNFRNVFHFPFSILNYRKGFTIIETIIYITILSVITSFVVIVFYQMIEGQNQHRNRVVVDQESNFIMQKVAWALTGATTINQPTGGTTSSVLSINKFNYGQNPIVFDLNARNVRISKASSVPVPLASNKVSVDSLIFEHIPSIQSAPEGVKITLLVSSSNISPPQASTTLESTIYLR